MVADKDISTCSVRYVIKIETIIFSANFGRLFLNIYNKKTSLIECQEKNIFFSEFPE